MKTYRRTITESRALDAKTAALRKTLRKLTKSKRKALAELASTIPLTDKQREQGRA